MTLDEKRKKYDDLLHAMQSGVAMTLEINYVENPNRHEATPKHLRVGVNSAMVGNGALLSLLAEKGILTEDEYLDHLIKAMEREVESYRSKLSKRLGTDVVLS